MELQPVGRYRGPRLPTVSVLDAHPELLRLLPRRWQRNPLVLAGLASVCGLVLGAARAVADDAAGPALKVAPIFQHGEGRGSFGCVSTNPPVFLGEEEARTVITEEAKAAGIAFEPDVLVFRNVDVPLTGDPPVAEDPDDWTEPHAPAKHKVTLDGTDPDRGISFEFVSMEDREAWMPYEWRPRSSVSWFDFIGNAASLGDALGHLPTEGAVGMFYDPLAPLFEPGAPRSWSEASGPARERAKEQLRKQVRDFIEWLKAEGVI